MNQLFTSGKTNLKNVSLIIVLLLGVFSFSGSTIISTPDLGQSTLTTSLFTPNSNFSIKSISFEKTILILQFPKHSKNSQISLTDTLLNFKRLTKLKWNVLINKSNFFPTSGRLFPLKTIPKNSKEEASLFNLG